MAGSVHASKARGAGEGRGITAELPLALVDGPHAHDDLQNGGALDP
jgi:hypothetical protein